MANGERVELRVERSEGPAVVLHPTSLRGDEQLGSLFLYALSARVAAERSLVQSLLGQRAVVTLRADSTAEGQEGPARRIAGLVGSARIVASDRDDAKATAEQGDFYDLYLEVRPLAFTSSLGSDRRIFRDMTAAAIAKDVLDRASVKHRFELQRAPSTRVYTVQQDESDWAFILRLCGEEGFYTWFDHEAESILVIADSSPSAPDHVEGTQLLYRAGSGLSRTACAVDEIGPIGRVRPSRVAYGSFDPARPGLKLRQESGETTGLEAYDAPGANVRDEAELQMRARIARERIASEMSAATGSAPLPHLTPGRAFELSGHDRGDLDKRWFVTAVRVELTAARAGVSTAAASVTFDTIPAECPFRLASQIAGPSQPGLVAGKIVSSGDTEIDLDAGGRARMHMHWDRRPDQASPGRWARVIQRGTAGSMLLPRAGWNVYALAEEGSIDEPTIVSRMVDAEHMPPYPLPGNMTRTTYKTSTSPGGGSHNEVRFEDKKGGEEMFVNASRDMTTEVGNDRSDAVHGNASVAIGNDQTVEVRSTKDDHVVGDDTLTIGGNWTEKVSADRTAQVGGAQSTTIGGSRKVSTGLNHTLSTGAGRDLKVGAALLDVTLGAIKSMSTVHHVLVGGAVIKATPRAMTERVGSEVSATMLLGRLPPKAAAALKIPGVGGAVGALAAKLKVGVGIAIQTIGALKVEQGKSRTLEVTGPLLETYGPTTWVADVFTETCVGPLNLTSNTLTGFAVSKLTLKSATSVTLKVGGTVLTVDCDSVTIASDELQHGKGTKVSIDAGKVLVGA